jgi:hypothetical protein
MLHLVYRFRLTAEARSNMTEFWRWLAERQAWFYEGLGMVEDTRWFTVTIGSDVHCLEHHVTFRDEAAWGSYREELRHLAQDLEWERRSASQYQWWEIIEARLLTDPPIPVPTPPPAGRPSLARRSRFLLDNARFVTLATSGPDGPWASTVNFVALNDPLRLLWYSQRTARHSQNIAATPRISGSLFLTGLTGADAPAGLPLDGGQLTGTCHEVSGDELPDLYHSYYQKNFPDEAVRQQWLLPLTDFHDDGPRRFYLLTVDRMWLFDAERWTVDRSDTRIEVPVT